MIILAEIWTCYYYYLSDVLSLPWIILSWLPLVLHSLCKNSKLMFCTLAHQHDMFT